MTLISDDFVAADIINYTIDGAEMLFSTNGLPFLINCRYKVGVPVKASYHSPLTPGASYFPRYPKSVTYVPSYQRTGTP